MSEGFFQTLSNSGFGFSIRVDSTVVLCVSTPVCMGASLCNPDSPGVP